MMRRLAAYWIRIISIAGQKIGLAATTAKVLFLLVARLTGLRHPAITSVVIKAWAVIPNTLQIHLTDIGEVDRQQSGAMAR